MLSQVKPFAFECFDSLLNGLNLHSNASNRFRMVRIWIRMVEISFEGFEFGLECFEFLSNDSNFDSNFSNLVCMVRIWIRMF